MITALALLLIPALLMFALYGVISMRETARQVRTRPARGFWAERQERKGRKSNSISYGAQGMKVECMGGPLDGRVESWDSDEATDRQPLEIQMTPSPEAELDGWQAMKGEYRPSTPGTEVTNADGLPIWHWYPSK